TLPYPFKTGTELLKICADNHLSISDVMLANEKTVRSEADVRAGLLRIWHVMQECVKRVIGTPGLLPGLGVKRRAADMYHRLVESEEASAGAPRARIELVDILTPDAHAE